MRIGDAPTSIVSIDSSILALLSAHLTVSDANTFLLWPWRVSDPLFQRFRLFRSNPLSIRCHHMRCFLSEWANTQLLTHSISILYASLQNAVNAVFYGSHLQIFIFCLWFHPSTFYIIINCLHPNYL